MRGGAAGLLPPLGEPRALWLALGAYAIWHVGGHVDAWYHLHYGFAIESFLTWPHAMLYAGVAATGAVAAARLLETRAAPAPWPPPGFGLLAVGTGLFLVGGGFDFVWHELFGFEANLETLLTPAHLWLVAASALAAGGLLLAAVVRRAAAGPGGYRPRAVDLAVVLALAILLRLALWSLFYATPLAVDYAAGGATARALPGYAGLAWGSMTAEVAGTGGIVLYTVILVLFVVVPTRRLRLPGGTIALLMLWDGVLTAAATDMWLYLPAVVAGALAGEAVWAWMWRGGLGGLAGERGYWLLGLAVPAVEFAAYVALAAGPGGGAVWTTHLWAGAPVIAGLFGLMAALLAAPPRVGAVVP